MALYFPLNPKPYLLLMNKKEWPLNSSFCIILFNMLQGLLFILCVTRLLNIYVFLYCPFLSFLWCFFSYLSPSYFFFFFFFLLISFSFFIAISIFFRHQHHVSFASCANSFHFALLFHYLPYCFTYYFMMPCCFASCVATSFNLVVLHSTTPYYFIL